MDRPEANEPTARVVSSGRVRGSAARVKVPIPGHEGAAGAPATIELVREGEVVRAIDVICSCGQRVRVVCDYEGAEGG